MALGKKLWIEQMLGGSLPLDVPCSRMAVTQGEQAHCLGAMRLLLCLGQVGLFCFVQQQLRGVIDDEQGAGVELCRLGHGAGFAQAAPRGGEIACAIRGLGAVGEILA